MAYCRKCGKEILDEAVVCVHCGCATQVMDHRYRNQSSDRQPITIVNNNSSSSSSYAGFGGRVRRHHSFLFDLFMIVITGGFWIIWMIIRPKYY